MYKNYLKPILDFSISIVTLITISPLLFFIGILIFFNLGRPIFFIQTRAGINGNPFNIIKFRTMKVNSLNKVTENERHTAFGKFLRKYSIDELPELINVIRGQMSIVGPRPLYLEYINHYNSEQLRRLEVKPGITGFAQVKGRNSIEWEEKFNHDVFYVDNLSFSFDMKIIFLTFYEVILNKNINYSEKETMPLFKGSDRIE